MCLLFSGLSVSDCLLHSLWCSLTLNDVFHRLHQFSFWLLIMVMEEFSIKLEFLWVDPSWTISQLSKLVIRPLAGGPGTEYYLCSVVHWSHVWNAVEVGNGADRVEQQQDSMCSLITVPLSLAMVTSSPIRGWDSSWPQ